MDDVEPSKPFLDDESTFAQSTTPPSRSAEGREFERGRFAQKVKKFFRPGGDREGRALFSRAAGRTTMSHYTELQIPDGPSVRLLHKGRLTDQQKDRIRKNIASAREKVNNAIATLDKDVPELMRDPEACALVARHFNIMPEAIVYGQGSKGIARINDRLKSIADGLYSPNLEIKLTDTLTDEPGRFGRVQRAPHRYMEGRATRGTYSDDVPGISLRFTKAGLCNLDRGSNNIISATGVNAANLSTRDANRFAMFASNLEALPPLDRLKEKRAEERAPQSDAPRLELPAIPVVSDFGDVRRSLDEVIAKNGDAELVQGQKDYLEQIKGSMAPRDYKAIDRALNEDAAKPSRYDPRSRIRVSLGRSG